MEKKTTRDIEENEIICAAIEVLNVLGKGFEEKVYQEAMALELTARGVPYFREPRVPIYYKQNQLTRYYQPDFICFNHIVVELKAVSSVGEGEKAQLFRYLKASKLTKALLLNFGADQLESRMVTSKQITVSSENHMTDRTEECGGEIGNRMDDRMDNNVSSEISIPPTF